MVYDGGGAETVHAFGQIAQGSHLSAGDAPQLLGLCLDPHDLAIAKYVAAREKDVQFNRQLVSRGLLDRERLLHLLDVTPISDTQRARIAASIDLDFGPARPSAASGAEDPE